MDRSKVKSFVRVRRRICVVLACAMIILVSLLQSAADLELRSDHLAGREVREVIDSEAVSQSTQIRGYKHPTNGSNVGWLRAYDESLVKYLHAATPCGGNDTFVAVVLTAQNNVDRRKAIRDTWGSQQKTVFVIGQDKNRNTTAIDEESKTYGDIIQFDFDEGYFYLTYNTISALRWVRDSCRDAEFIVKGDDDSWFNMDRLRDAVKVRDDPAIWGFVMKMKTNRAKKSKWFTPKTVIKDDHLPAFTSGAGYVMNREAARILYETVIKEDFVLNLEDLFVTGYMAEKLGIPRVNTTGFFNHRFKSKQVNARNYYENVIQAHELRPSEMRSLWNELRKSGKVHALI